MAIYEAELDTTNKQVLRVVVSPHEGWAAETLGGTWTVCDGDEVTDPGPPGRLNAGKGHYYDFGVPETFVYDVWDSDKATIPNPETGIYFYRHEGMLTWHGDKAWRNLMPDDNPNVWEPPTNWREYPMGNEHPLWVQPSGAVDAYPDEFIVEHEGSVWQSNISANVWEPPEQWTKIT